MNSQILNNSNKNQKLLVITRCDEKIKPVTDITHPIIKKFAKDWNADFLKLEEYVDCPDDGKYHYRILEFYDLLEKYDRILHIDSDILINKNCPNVFKIVPENKIGTIYEDKGSRTEARRKLIIEIQEAFGDVGWKSGYINTGFFLVSKQHQKIFEKINGKLWMDIGWDDVHLGYNVHKYNFEVYELPYQFNHMTMFSEPWNGNANRFDSYIIHYAGKGIFDIKKFRKFTPKARIKQIKRDFKKIYGKNKNKSLKLKQ